MHPDRWVGLGLAAVAAPPVEVAPDELDDELLDLLCDDGTWVDATFEAIVAASWSEPPHEGEGRRARPPRRRGRPRARHSRRAAQSRAQFAARPARRQRSPPRSRD